MKEAFLHFVWKHQYFNKIDLKTQQGASIKILDPGQINTNAGPDFSQARVRIDRTEWVGLIEIHVSSSDWYCHKHQSDTNYDQVILHVVWIDDRAVKTSKGHPIPTLVLNGRISTSMLLNQQKLEMSNSNIPCTGLFNLVDHAAVRGMMDKTIQQRLQRKSLEVLKLLQKSDGDWDQVTYQMFARNFGFHVNSDAFSMLVQMLPLSLVRKVRSNLLQIEALLFGQAGMLLSMTGDSYYRSLQSEYDFLKAKFSLSCPVMRGNMWKYLRLRPSNFPAIRIAQFATFLHQKGYRFSSIREAKNRSDFSFNGLVPSDYWKFHYDFSKSGGSGGLLGRTSVDSLLINSVVPLLEAYAQYSSQQECRLRALTLLEQLPAERNRILSYWKASGFKLSSALDSQALLELNNQYCHQKKCLRCEIGVSLLKRTEN